MIRVSVMYPKSEGSTFDIDYYKTKHMAIVDATIKPVRWEVDSGLNGPYMAIGHLYFDSMETMGASMGAAGDALADIPNFTNVEAATQISEILS